MKLISRFEATTLNTAVLHALHEQNLRAFLSAARGSNCRKAALASLNAIEDELACRAPNS